ncbi:hypothetical protein ABIB99_002023 [Bradyrhizobium sp. LA6.1]|uniref:hypothetical protein n=1 Tax=Bradyrhizobium sp. LA6.1 TaxID=3156378 RepID=UPI00339728FB
MPADLTMRRTVIGGETAQDDYIVIWDELTIGRIFRSIGVGGAQTWSWSVSLPNVPQPSTHRGRASSLDAAKASFRGAWSDLQAKVGYEEIKAAREIQARRRPWHR